MKKIRDSQGKCSFENEGQCFALACFDGKKCGARNKDGHPMYAPSQQVLKRMTQSEAKK